MGGLFYEATFPFYFTSFIYLLCSAPLFPITYLLSIYQKLYFFYDFSYAKLEYFNIIWSGGVRLCCSYSLGSNSVNSNNARINTLRKYTGTEIDYLLNIFYVVAFYVCFFHWIWFMWFLLFLFLFIEALNTCFQFSTVMFSGRLLIDKVRRSLAMKKRLKYVNDTYIIFLLIWKKKHLQSSECTIYIQTIKIYHITYINIL